MRNTGERVRKGDEKASRCRGKALVSKFYNRYVWFVETQKEKLKRVGLLNLKKKRPCPSHDSNQRDGL